MKQYSIAEARDAFTGIVHSVESDGPVTLTRRGHAVAVLLSAAEYEHLIRQPVSCGEAYDAFRETHDLTALDIEPVIFDIERERSPGREVSL
jgi:prevent-host-death family protein